MTTPNRRHRLVPVACCTTEGDPDGIHLLAEEWVERLGAWVTNGLAPCGRPGNLATLGTLPADTPITCTDGPGNCAAFRDAYQRALDGRPTAEQETIARLQSLVRELEAALEAARTARLNEPILRHCIYPGCLREYDVNATLCGRTPERPTWSGKGWLQVRQLDGDICPDHSHVVGNTVAPGPHLPRWDYGEHGAPSVLRCPCGWASPPVRWRRYATEAWKDHILPAGQDLRPRRAASPQQDAGRQAGHA